MSSSRKRKSSEPLSAPKRTRTSFDTTSGLVRVQGAHPASIISGRRYSGTPKCLDVQILDDGTPTPGTHVIYNMKTDMNTADGIIPINLINPGAGSWNRIGRKTKATRLSWDLTICAAWNPASAATFGRKTGFLRVLIVHDKAPNGQLPAKNQILASKNLAGQEYSSWNSMPATDQIERIKILKDMKIKFEPASKSYSESVNGNFVEGTGFISTDITEADVQTYVNITGEIKLNIASNYQAETIPQTIDCISTGALYVVFLSNNLGTWNSAPSLRGWEPIINAQGTIRLHYYDNQ